MVRRVGLSGTRSLGLNLRLKNGARRGRMLDGARCEHYCLTKRGSVTQREGSVYEWRASAGRNKKRCLRITLRCLRKNWDVMAVLRGWEMYHLKVHPSIRIVSTLPGNGWFGQLIQRSNDAARRGAVGNQFNYDGVPGTHQW